MVEFLEDIWCKIKSFKTAPYFNLDADSFIIKDVVLEYVSRLVILILVSVMCLNL